MTRERRRRQILRNLARGRFSRKWFARVVEHASGVLRNIVPSKRVEALLEEIVTVPFARSYARSAAWWVARARKEESPRWQVRRIDNAAEDLYHCVTEVARMSAPETTQLRGAASDAVHKALDELHRRRLAAAEKAAEQAADLFASQKRLAMVELERIVAAAMGAAVIR